MKISHRFSLITALCLLAGISRAQSWLPQALPGESAFRLLECDCREARLETCLSVLPASASFLVGIERRNAATPVIVWLDRKKGIGTILLADRGWISVIFGPTIMGIDKKR